MAWCYAPMKHTSPLGETYYAVHEVYFTDEGIWGWTDGEGDIPQADTPEELVGMLEDMLKDVKSIVCRDKRQGKLLNYDMQPQVRMPMTEAQVVDIEGSNGR